ncbi:MAG TPA: hypothetical protein VGG01_13610 [Xanthobacteraceae bacterium]
MAELLHPQATHHLPSFITPPGETDVLMVVTAVILLSAVIGFGVLFLRLHALPEHIAHGSHKMQMELVSVLCLIALFTHMHIFWIAGLILAFIEFPDFGHPLRRIAGSVEKMAGVEPDDGAAGEARPAHDARADVTRTDDVPPHVVAGAQPQRPAAASAKPVAATTNAADKELSHA